MGGTAPGPVMCRVLVLSRYAWAPPAAAPPDPEEALKLTVVARALTHAPAHPSTGQPT